MSQEHIDREHRNGMRGHEKGAQECHESTLIGSTGMSQEHIDREHRNVAIAH